MGAGPPVARVVLRFDRAMARITAATAMGPKPKGDQSGSTAIQKMTLRVPRTIQKATPRWRSSSTRRSTGGSTEPSSGTRAQASR